MNQVIVEDRSLALCVKNDGYEVDLCVGKIYPVLADDYAAEAEQIRVIDESGEDLLYPQSFFIPVELSQSAREILSVG